MNAKEQPHVPHGLCLRCQRRLDAIENGHEFRYECSQWMITDNSDDNPSYFSCHSCYGYLPQLPIVLSKTHKEDPRPFPAPAFISSRCHAVREAKRITEDEKRGEVSLSSVKTKDGIILFWKATERRDKKRNI